MGIKQKYRIMERLDVGGMAEVFVGRALSVEGIEKKVAIKRILPSLTKKKKFREMFLDEARLSMRLNHANIVQVFDVGRAGGTFFIVMEYVDGVNLRRIFQRASELGYRIPLPVACYILIEVCKGLAHAHESKDDDGKPMRIVHRDVSPPNVLISRSGEVRIVDFGLAKAVTQVALTDPGIVKGKFSYVSPEAAEGKPVDHRADIFSAGIVLFELLSNRQLFTGRTDVETLENVRAAEMPPLSKLNPEVPEAFERIVRKALEKDVQKRYSSARDFGDDLSNFLFHNSLKVTTTDLQSVFRRLIDEEVTVDRDGRQRIEDLIEEEILNLSMIGHLTEVTTEGSRPISIEGLPRDLPARHDLSDVWETPVAAPRPMMAAEARPGPPVALELSEQLEGVEPPADAEDATSAALGGGPSVVEQRRQERARDKGISGVAIFVLALLAAAVVAAALFLFVFNK